MRTPDELRLGQRELVKPLIAAAVGRVENELAVHPVGATVEVVFSDKQLPRICHTAFASVLKEAGWWCNISEETGQRDSTEWAVRVKPTDRLR